MFFRLSVFGSGDPQLGKHGAPDLRWKCLCNNALQEAYFSIATEEAGYMPVQKGTPDLRTYCRVQSQWVTLPGDVRGKSRKAMETNERRVGDVLNAVQRGGNAT